MVLKLAVALVPSVSLPTSPAVMVIVGVAVVLAS